jgi:DNA-binding response OmpR family regulator
MTRSALIVEPILPDALFMIEAVTALGFQVTAARTFHEAVESLRLAHVLVVADIRLGEYNGLHLVLRSKSARPELAAMVTCASGDAVLQSEAEHLGATFVIKPLSIEEVRAAICRTVRRSDGCADPIRMPFERRRCERRGDVGGRFHPDRRVTDRRSGLGLFTQAGVPAE